MALAYLLDENQRGILWRALQRHNARAPDPLDITRVGDPPDLRLGSNDQEVLFWAEANERILVSRDQKTLLAHLTDHLAAGRHSPGVFVLRRRARIRDIVDFLAEASHSSEPSEWRDRIEYIP